MKKRKKSSSRRTLLKNTDKAQPEFAFPSFLLPKERIIFKTNPHWLLVVAPEVALATFGILILEYLPSLLPGLIQLQQEIIMFFGAALSFVIIVIYLDWISTRYYLTNLRLIEERGIIGKRIVSIGLDKVQDVTCKFGILGRIFGFGNIEIESAGTYGKIVFGYLPSPRKLQEKIEGAILISLGMVYQDMVDVVILGFISEKDKLN